MFLDEVSLPSILSWVESHPVTVGVGTTVTAGSLWFYKFLRQKQAEALFGFYARLMFQLKNLRKRLDDKYWLEIGNPDKGNIYALIYDKKILSAVCGKFSGPSDEELADIKELTSKLEKTLTESHNNVYPRVSDKEEWYDQQQVLFDFCEFIKSNSMHGKTNIAQDGDTYKHIIKCKELTDAMDYILASIKSELCDTSTWAEAAASLPAKK